MILRRRLRFLFLTLCSSILMRGCLRSALSPDGLTLLAFKSAVSGDPASALAGWNEADADPCRWIGVSCAEVPGFSHPRVVALSLPAKRLSGYIPSELGSLVFLRHLNLHGNLLSGSIPLQLSSAASLHSIYLHSNNLSGRFPSTLCDLPGLQNLDLSVNSLSGALPAELGRCRRLQRLLLSNNRLSDAGPSGIWPALVSLTELDLSSNELAGRIPPDLGGLKSLVGTLNLSYNHFSGEIPGDLGNLPPAVRMDLRWNNLSGEIPPVGALSNQGATAFLGNPNLCGFPLNNPCRGLPPTPLEGERVPSPLPGDGRIAGDGAITGKGLRPEVIILIAVADAAGVALIGLLVLYAYWKLKGGDRCSCSCTGKTKLGGRGNIGGLLCLRRRRRRTEERASSPSGNSEEDDVGSDGSPRGTAAESRLVALDKGFAWELDELLRASAYVLGKSRKGMVYKVVVGVGVAVAVRRLGEGGARRRREFAAEALAIGRVRHPNVVRLRAYFWSADEKLLVSDFIPNGSLAAALHGRPSQTGLSWTVRVKIARGAARGLAHIHECSPRRFVHGEVKPSNILLDADFTPHIADFGLLRLLHIAGGGGASGPLLPYANPGGPAAVDRPSAGSYRAPEARAPLGGRPTQKWDVYSFGLVLLELLTGKAPEFSSPCPPAAEAAAGGEPAAELVTWVREGLEGERSLSELSDPALIWQARAKGDVAAAFRLALACTETDPELRPRMKAVSESLETIGV